MQTEEDRRRQTPKTLVLLFSGIKKCFYRKEQQRLKEIYLVKQQQQKEPQKSLKKDILHKHLQIHSSNFASHGTHPMKYFASLVLFMYQGRETQR